MTDIYSPPSADLAEPHRGAPAGAMGSLEAGLSGDYELSAMEVISQAWKRTSGAKGTVWLMILFYVLISIPVSLAAQFIVGLLGLEPATGASFVATLPKTIATQLIQMPVLLPMAAGMYMVGVKLAAGVPVEASEIFSYFKKIVPLLITSILVYLLTAIGFLLLVIPGIYLAVSYVLAVPLVVEKNMSPWQALETSRKTISHHWFSVAGFYLLLFVIAALAAIPLGIGLIWAMPMMTIAVGLAYCKLFGYEGGVAR